MNQKMLIKMRSLYFWTFSKNNFFTKCLTQLNFFVMFKNYLTKKFSNIHVMRESLRKIKGNKISISKVLFFKIVMILISF